jgi:hypothetical protein
MFKILLWPFKRIKEYFEIKKRIKELKERDPFIYK